MNLERQVTSLEISKRLKELGAWQDTLFYWTVDSRDKIKPHKVIWKGGLDKIHSDKVSILPAYTVAELGEILPSYIVSHKSIADVDSGNVAEGFVVKNEEMKLGEPRYQHSKTEADARGKMLIYLLENKLI